MEQKSNLSKTTSRASGMTNILSDLGNEETIIYFLEQGGQGVALTPKQEELLDRWTYADEKIRENVGKGGREKIANLIMAKYNCKRATAYADIVAAERVFSSSAPLNKKYRIALRIEFLERQSKLAGDEGDRDAVARIEKEIRGYYAMYPDEQPERSPKNIIFIIGEGASIETDITEDIAFEEADSVLKQLEDEDNDF